MEMKVTPIDFSRQVAEDSRSLWLKTLGNQFISRSPCIRHTKCNYCISYCRKLLEYIHQSLVNAHVVYIVTFLEPSTYNHHKHTYSITFVCGTKYEAVKKNMDATLSSRRHKSPCQGH